MRSSIFTLHKSSSRFLDVLSQITANIKTCFCCWPIDNHTGRPLPQKKEEIWKEVRSASNSPPTHNHVFPRFGTFFLSWSSARVVAFVHLTLFPCVCPPPTPSRGVAGLGLNVAWRDRLEEMFTWPQMTMDDASHITDVEDDFELAMRRLTPGVDTWATLGERARQRVLSFLASASTRQYRVLFDDKRFVPPNKRLEQDSRDSTQQPFTRAEQSRILIGHTPIPTPSMDFFQRLLATRDLRPQLYAFVVLELVKIPLQAGKTLVIDGGIPASIIDYASRADAVVRVVADYAHDDDVEFNVGAAAAAAAAASDATAGAAAASAAAPPIDDGIVYNDYGVPIDLRSGYGDVQEAPPLPFVIPDEPQDASMPTTITITRRADASLGVRVANDVHIAPRPRICGEGDYKIADGISMLSAGSVIFVRSCDTDMIMILLMNMRRWVDAKTQMLRYTVLLDTNGPVRDKSKERPTLNVSELWRQLMRTFHVQYSWVKHPVETFATLILLTGSDYVMMKAPDLAEISGVRPRLSKGLPQVGPAAVWNAFKSPRGREILFPAGMEDHPPVVVDIVHGDTSHRVAIGVDEKRWRTFAIYIYHRTIMGPDHRKVPFVLDTHHQYNDMETLVQARVLKYQKALEKCGGNATAVHESNTWQLPSVAQLATMVRALAWNLDYGINAASTSPFLNPFATQHDVSIYGWTVDSQTGRVAIADGVTGAPVV